MNNLIPESTIRYVAFNIPAEKETSANASVFVNNSGVMKHDKPVPEGLYDAHMGTTDISWDCQTCANTKEHCTGHSGALHLKYPVKASLYKNFILKVLKVICFECSGLLVRGPPKLSELVKLVKNVTKCPHCNASKLTIQKDKNNSLIFYRVQIENKKIIKKIELFNHHIKKAFEKITEETLSLMGLPIESHPKNTIRYIIEIPSNTIRPDIKQVSNNRPSMNDLTLLLKTVTEINNGLPDQIPPDEHISQVVKDGYYNLELAYANFIGNGSSQMAITLNSREAASIIKRIKGKESTPRAHLLGKRVILMIRSVITGDPSLKLDEVGIPVEYAMRLGIPETVTENNYDKMLVYFNNSVNKYPGCKHIIKASNGEKYNRAMIGDYILSVGDIVMRNLIDGDLVMFNRQPSVIYSSVSAMSVKIIYNKMTICINPGSCIVFQADFDGDSANVIIHESKMAHVESMHTSNIKRWAISIQNRTPTFGSFQDALIGIFKFTKNGVEFNKWKAMQCVHDTSKNNLVFENQIVTNYELISMILPKITILNMVPAFYKQAYTPFIKYDPKEIVVKIIRGKMESGRFDKGIVGQGQLGSIFQIIANEFGNEAMFESIFNFQQLAFMLFVYTGFTLGLSDVTLSEIAREEVKNNIEKMLVKADDITKKLKAGALIPPLGMSTKDFYENEQLSALTVPEDFIYTVLKDIDVDNNNFYQMVDSGSKGKTTNFTAITAVIGSHTIEGQRFPPQSGYGRALPYFLRFDPSPMANGFNPNSFYGGVDLVSFINSAKEARHGFIGGALSTAKAGYQNRMSIKNLETAISNNLRQTVKNFNILQLLYGCDGCNPARTEYIKFPTVLLSNEEMESYRSKTNEFEIKCTQDILDEEFNQLIDDRDTYRNLSIKLEESNPSVYLLNNYKYMPVNVERIIDNIVNNYISITGKLDPIEAIKKVDTLCDELGYVFQNDICRFNKKPIPTHMKTAVRLMQILIRSHLCTKELIKRNVNNKTLKYIVEKILITYKKALIEPGTSVGILAAQCVCERFTQYVLDSRHRTGGQGGSKTDSIVRMQEILRAADSKKMKNPHMIIALKEEYEENKQLVQEIANHIEMMTFNQFIQVEEIFYEQYGEPTHPDFIHEKKIFEEFAKYHFGVKVPNDLAKWCIRIELNRQEMIMKSIKIETIVSAISVNYPSLFLVYNQENNDGKLIIRIYLRSTQFKITNDFLNTAVLFILDKIKQVVVRGVNDIISTSVKEVSKSTIDKDGKIVIKKVNMIFTVGTNLPEILFNKYVDHTRTITDSIIDMETVYGISSAENFIVQEMINTLTSLDPTHCSIFAAEMCFNGKVYDVQRNNPRRNEENNVLMQASFQNVPQVLERAATEAQVDTISGVSAPLMMGTNPTNIGTTYNIILIDEELVASRSLKAAQLIDDL